MANDGEANGEPLWRDAGGRVLARIAVVGKGTRIALPGALTPADMPLLLDGDFPQRLRAAFGGAASAPTRAPAMAMRPRVETGLAAPSARSPASIHPLDAWLALLIAGLFLAERFVATTPRAVAQA